MRAFAIITLLATVVFSQTVSDPYRYLENVKSPQTQAWIDAQNARAERVIEAYPNRKQLADRVAQLETTGAIRYAPQLVGTTLFYLRETPPAPQPVLVGQAWPVGNARVIVDPARFGAAAAIQEVWPSPDGRFVAVGIAQAGNESTTIHVLDVARGTWFNEALGPCGGGTTDPAVAWDHHAASFTYTRLPGDGSQFNVKLYHHVLGTPQSADRLALGAISPIAEYELLTSEDGAHAAALVHFGDGAFDRVYLRDGAAWKPVLGPDAGVTGGAYVGDRLLVIATNGSLRGRIAALQADGTLQTVVPEASDWAYQQIAPIRGGFLVVKSWGTTWAVDHFDDGGSLVRTIGLPAHGIGIDGIASSRASGNALIVFEGWAGPADRWVAYHATSGVLRTVYDLALPSPRYRKVRTYEITATSKDGTHVPVTVIALAGTPMNGTAPAILTGYGGFRISTAPYFIGYYLAWLERGGVYAVANIRGGSEFGEAWHRGGMLTNKQNVFDDFYASAQALVAYGWTSTKRLGIIGGSNGGLLVGAAMVQHPDEYRAVVGEAGIYDTLRHHLFPNGAYSVTEYGSTDNRDDFLALFAYSPYHNVKKGVDYPATLLVTSENDPRVASWQSWKFAAALQNATASSEPIVVFTHVTGGHGHGESFAQAVGNAALGLTFLAQQLGVK